MGKKDRTTIIQIIEGRVIGKKSVEDPGRDGRMP